MSVYNTMRNMFHSDWNNFRKNEENHFLDFTGATFRFMDMSLFDLSNCCFDDCKFVLSNLSGCWVHNSSFKRATFTDCNLTHIHVDSSTELDFDTNLELIFSYLLARTGDNEFDSTLKELYWNALIKLNQPERLLANLVKESEDMYEHVFGLSFEDSSLWKALVELKGWEEYYNQKSDISLTVE